MNFFMISDLIAYEFLLRWSELAGTNKANPMPVSLKEQKRTKNIEVFFFSRTNFDFLKTFFDNFLYHQNSIVVLKSNSKRCFSCNNFALSKTLSI